MAPNPPTYSGQATPRSLQCWAMSATTHCPALCGQITRGPLSRRGAVASIAHHGKLSGWGGAAGTCMRPCCAGMLRWAGLQLCGARPEGISTSCLKHHTERKKNCNVRLLSPAQVLIRPHPAISGWTCQSAAGQAGRDAGDTYGDFRVSPQWDSSQHSLSWGAPCPPNAHLTAHPETLGSHKT